MQGENVERRRRLGRKQLLFLYYFTCIYFSCYGLVLYDVASFADFGKLLADLNPWFMAAIFGAPAVIATADKLQSVRKPKAGEQ